MLSLAFLQSSPLLGIITLTIATIIYTIAIGAINGFYP